MRYAFVISYIFGSKRLHFGFLLRRFTVFMEIQNALEPAVAHQFYPICNRTAKFFFVKLKIMAFSFTLGYCYDFQRRSICKYQRF